MSSSVSEVAVVIPCWNSGRWLPGCLSSLGAQHYRDFSVILVDNGSTDGSVEIARSSLPAVEVLRFSSNRGFAAAVNAGIARSSSPYIALLNADTRAAPDWLGELVEAMKRAGPEVGYLASKMLDLSDPSLMENGGDSFSWQGAAWKRGRGRPAAEYVDTQEVFSACAGAALYRRELLEKIGMFDESFFAYLEDVDLGLRARLKGYRCLFVPTAEVLHQGHSTGISSGDYVRLVTRNRLLLFAKNIPAPLMVKNLHKIIYGQVYFFLVYRRPVSSLLGYLSFLALAPEAFRKRRFLLRDTALSLAQIEKLLDKDMPEPSLRELLLARLGALRR
jgi:GT2 family glycosyltransferase